MRLFGSGQAWSVGESADADLMRALGTGNRIALGELVKRHQEHVRSLAFRIMGRWEDADDVAQETFLRVLRGAGGYTPAASFRTWLHRIVVNLCLDRARRPKIASLEQDVPAADVGQGSAMERRERSLAVQHAVSQLPERQRIALLLHRFEGHSHAEIAQATGWSESAVEALLVRAYSHLRQALLQWQE